MALDNLMEKSASEKVEKAKIDLMDDHPFYAYIIEFVNIIEVEADSKTAQQIPTAAVDFEGNLYYNTDFIERIPQNEVIGVLAHEILHIILEGKQRKRGRSEQRWNIAQDIVINHIVSQDELDLPDVPYIPDSDGTLDIDGVEYIEDMEDETFESVYEKVNETETEEIEVFIDGHIYDSDGEEMELPAEAQNVDVDWEKVSKKAKQAAKKRGEEPLGAGERVKKGTDSETDYRALIQKHLSSLVPRDFTYRKPHKKSHQLGFYRPDIRHEKKVNVAVALDTSGSISGEDLRNFLSEVCQLASQYPIIDITLIQHDAAVHRVEEYSNPSKAEFEDLDIEGRGGTNHKPVFAEIEDLNERFDALIALTDGYTEIPKDEPKYKVIWVLNNFDVDESTFHFGEIVRTYMANSDQ